MAKVDPQALRYALGNYATGVTIIGARAPDGALVGMTVNSFSSVSLDPPLVLFCPARSLRALDVYAAAPAFSVNILSAAQRPLSELFARRGESKWETIDHVIGASGAPIIPGALASFECATAAVHEAGDHLIVVGEVRALRMQESADPLLFFRSRYRTLSHYDNMDLEASQAAQLGWGL